MKNFLWLFSLALLPFFASAQSGKHKDPILAKYKDFKKSSSGLYYKFYNDVPSPNLTPEQFLIVDMKITILPKDSVIRNSWNEPQRLQMYVTPSTYAGSLEEAFLMTSPGDSVAFIINADSMWAKSVRQPLPPFIPKGSFMHFLIKPQRAFSREQFTAYQDSLSLLRRKEEEKIIEEVILKEGLTAQRTPSGAYYVMVTPGTGVQPKAGQNVQVHYSGYLLNGTKFDSSIDRGMPFDFAVGTGAVIAGWDEGILMMKAGEKGLLLIPSDMGYGSRGAPPSIPANAILIFEVQLLEVR